MQAASPFIAGIFHCVQDDILCLCYVLLRSKCIVMLREYGIISILYFRKDVFGVFAGDVDMRNGFERLEKRVAVYFAYDRFSVFAE